MVQKQKTKEKTGQKLEKKPTATQRIQQLEQQIGTLNQHISFLANQAEQLKKGFENSVTVLSKKMDAVVQAGSKGQISKESVEDIMKDERVKELKNLIDSMVEQGVLELKDKDQLSDNKTFLVGQQVDDSGNVVNPRLQFYIDSIQSEEVKDKLIGRSVGDILELEKDQPKLEITELYSIKEVDTDKEYEEPEQQKKSS